MAVVRLIGPPLWGAPLLPASMTGAPLPLPLSLPAVKVEVEVFGISPYRLW